MSYSVFVHQSFPLFKAVLTRRLFSWLAASGL